MANLREDSNDADIDDDEESNPPFKILDLSNKGLQKLDKELLETCSPFDIDTLLLDNNDLKKIENLESFVNLKTLSASKNHIRRLLSLLSLKTIQSLDLSNNALISIEGLKDLKCLKHLNLAGNYIKLIDRLQSNTQLEYLDLSDNAIGHVNDLSYLVNLKALYLHKNHLSHLSYCEKYLPASLEILTLHENNISDLAEVSRLGNLNNLKELTIHGNPCVDFGIKPKPTFNYRPYLKIWCLNLLKVDGVLLDPLESLKAEWLYSQGRGRNFRPGEHSVLAEYLSTACPPNTEKSNALPPDEERKLRLILSKAEQHQQQLREQIASGEPISSTPRAKKAKKLVGVAERMVASCHDSFSRDSLRASPEIMSKSFDSAVLHGSPPSSKKNSGDSHPLQTATTLVPVPESLISPDVSRPLHPLLTSPSPTPSSARSPQNLKRIPRGTQYREVGRGARSPVVQRKVGGSPRSGRNSLESSPGKKQTSEEEDEMIQQRTNRRRMKTHSEPPKREIPKPKIEKKTENSEAWKAAVCIQRRWRGYRTRNLNEEVLHKLKTIQANRIQDYIIKVSKDMEATKQALEGNRKLQVLQMQAINAMWRKISGDDGLDGLAATCGNLFKQMAELQQMVRTLQMNNSSQLAVQATTQTEIIAVHSPEDEEHFPFGAQKIKKDFDEIGDILESVCVTTVCQEEDDFQEAVADNLDKKKSVNQPS